VNHDFFGAVGAHRDFCVLLTYLLTDQFLVDNRLSMAVRSITFKPRGWKILIRRLNAFNAMKTFKRYSLKAKYDITKLTAKLKNSDNILLLVLISWPHSAIYSTVTNTVIDFFGVCRQASAALAYEPKFCKSLQGRSRSVEMAPFDRSHTSSRLLQTERLLSLEKFMQIMSRLRPQFGIRTKSDLFLSHPMNVQVQVQYKLYTHTLLWEVLARS